MNLAEVFSNDMSSVLRQYEVRMASSQSIFAGLRRATERLSQAMLAPSKALERMQEERLAFVRSACQWESMIADIQKQHQERMAAPLRALQQALNGQQDVWQKMLRRSTSLPQLTVPKIQVASLSWDFGIERLIDRFREVGLMGRMPKLSSRLLEPSRAYTAFVDRTFGELQQCQDELRSKALLGSVRLAEGQHLTTTDSLCAVIALPAQADEPGPPLELRSPDVQQQELLAAKDIGDEADADALLKLSPAATEAERTRVVLSLVIDCNEQAKAAGGQGVFKPTDRVLETFVHLPWMIPCDRRSFADFVDCLYFLFYEGAGRDNLRFLRDKGGVLDRSDCDLIWGIKYLRNKWTRHDQDHGKEAAIRKSWEALLSELNRLGLGHLPSEPDDFRHLHRRLLQEAEAFLRTLLAKLRGR